MNVILSLCPDKASEGAIAPAGDDDICSDSGWSSQEINLISLRLQMVGPTMPSGVTPERRSLPESTYQAYIGDNPEGTLHLSEYGIVPIAYLSPIAYLHHSAIINNHCCLSP